VIKLKWSAPRPEFCIWTIEINKPKYVYKEDSENALVISKVCVGSVPKVLVTENSERWDGRFVYRNIIFIKFSTAITHN